MKIGIIGEGAIGGYVRERVLKRGHEVLALLLRSELLEDRDAVENGAIRVSSVADLPSDVELMIDCAGHQALEMHGPGILRRGIDLATVSIGGLSDEGLYRSLEQAAQDGDARLHLVSGAIGALDALRAARIGNLQRVHYIGRKPPQSWKGSPAESKLDLDRLTSAAVHFDGSARDAAMEYPKNANVAAAVALSGVGFEHTQVQLIADPGASENIHEIAATGDFGELSFQIRGAALPENPRSSALAAMSVVSKIEEETRRIRF